MLLLYKKNILITTFLVLAIFLGAFFRFSNLDSQAYWMDEGYTINAIQSTIQNGTSKGSAILDSGKTYFCPLYCSPSAIITKTYGENAWSYRVLSVIFGILFILLTYYLAKVFFKKQNVALLATFFVSLSYWQIAWSRQARWYTMLEVFFWLALLCFYYFLKIKDKKKKLISLIASILFTILVITTHKIAYLLPIIMLIWYLLEQTTFNKKKTIIALGSTTILLIIAEYGFGLHFITHAITNVTLAYNLPYYLSFYLSNYWIFIILGIYGLFSTKKETRKNIILLSIPLLLYLFFLSFFTKIIHYRYLFHLTPIFYLIASAVTIDIIEKIKHNYGKLILLILLILAFFISSNGLIVPKSFYLLEADDPSKMSRPYYAYTPQPNWNLAYNEIKNNINNDEIVISSHPHFNKIFLNQPGYWIKYNYLGMEDTPNQTSDNKEFYVGAEIINNLEELKNITNTKHGYIIFDYMASDGKIDSTIIKYINNNFKLFFYNEVNSYSKIWIYQF